MSVDLKSVQTNMVLIDHSGSGLSTEEFMSKLKRLGLLATPRPPRHVRVVINRHHDDAVIGEALAVLRKAAA